MLFRDVAELISIENTGNDIGDVIESKQNRQVFVNKKSIRQSEFYQAQATGLKPEIMLEMRAMDYSGEKKLRYEDLEYNIIRTYSKNGEIIELICSRIIGG